MLVVSNFSVSFQGKKLLESVNFSLKKGELIVLQGVNGSGKSTLLNALLGIGALQISKEAKVFLDQEAILNLPIEEKISRGLFFTFQNPVNLPGISLVKLLRELGVITADNVKSFVAELKHWAKKMHFSEGLLIRGLNENFSGGEKKKLELLQAWYLAKNYLFLDEVDTGVDLETQKIMAEMINSLKQKALGIMVVTHSPTFQKYLRFDRVLTMKKTGQLIT